MLERRINHLRRIPTPVVKDGLDAWRLAAKVRQDRLTEKPRLLDPIVSPDLKQDICATSADSAARELDTLTIEAGTRQVGRWQAA